MLQLQRRFSRSLCEKPQPMLSDTSVLSIVLYESRARNFGQLLLSYRYDSKTRTRLGDKSIETNKPGSSGSIQPGFACRMSMSLLQS